MSKLFAVVLGGRADGCNIELHDVVFVVGNSIEETYPQLRKKWFGNKKRLHIDSVIELTYADQHQIMLSKEKPAQDKKLFFVNFGAYKPNYFGETHETQFYVGRTKTEVLARAKQELCLSLIEPHCDDNLPVDDILAVDAIDEYHVHLVPTKNASNVIVESFYRRLSESPPE